MKTALLILFLCVPAARAQDEGYLARPALLNPGGFMIYMNSEAPLSFLTMTPKEIPAGAEILPGDVKGRSCQHGLSIPLGSPLKSQKISGAKGKGGYEKALKDLHKNHPGIRGIFDVKIDTHVLSILGIYKRTCTEIFARAFK